ncbi:MAG: hypothetical protein J2P49_10840 [Methylocapsa sp.]|nr:hypothetical protein [Methylocapsa sp.]
MKTLLSAISLSALVALSLQAKAAPRSIDDCEKIQAADAYNLCLASFGPVARKVRGAADGAQIIDTSSSSGEAATSRARRHHRHAARHGWRHRFARHGSGHRMRAELVPSTHG